MKNKLIFFAVLILNFTSICLADYKDNPPPQTGFTHPTAYADDTSQRIGKPLTGASDVTFSSTVIADIDNDPSNGNEIVVGSSDGKLIAFSSTGNLLWSVTVPFASCWGDGVLQSSPSVGDLFGNGINYVVVGFGGITASSCPGGVVAYKGTDGSRLFTFNMKKFASAQGYSEDRYGVISTPALADTDNDGDMEIAIGGFDRNAYLLDKRGKVLFYYHAADTVWSSPVFANIDNDPNLEMIIGTDITENNEINPPTRNGGFLYAFDTHPRTPKRLEFRDSGAYKWAKFFPQAIYSSPVVADLIPSSPGLEIAMGSSCVFPDGVSNKTRIVRILRASTGRVLKKLTSPGCFTSSFAVGDIENDGTPEIFAPVNGSNGGSGGVSRLVAWRPATSRTPIWSMIPKDRGFNDADGGHIQSAVVADINGDGSLEVLVANTWTIVVVSASTGAPLTCLEEGCAGEPGITLFGWDSYKSTPSLGDIDGDGDLEVVIGGGNIYNGGIGALYVWTNLASVISSDSGPHAAYSTPWPTARGSSTRVGLFEE